MAAVGSRRTDSATLPDEPCLAGQQALALSLRKRDAEVVRAQGVRDGICGRTAQQLVYEVRMGRDRTPRLVTQMYEYAGGGSRAPRRDEVLKYSACPVWGNDQDVPASTQAFSTGRWQGVG